MSWQFTASVQLFCYHDGKAIILKVQQQQQQQQHEHQQQQQQNSILQG